MDVLLDSGASISCLSTDDATRIMAKNNWSAADFKRHTTASNAFTADAYGGGGVPFDGLLKATSCYQAGQTCARIAFNLSDNPRAQSIIG